MKKQQMGEKIDIDNFILTYFLTETEILVEGEKHLAYGIEIEKRSLSKIESSIIKNVTVNKARIEEIIEIIRTNEVTPVHLYDVIENFL